MFKHQIECHDGILQIVSGCLSKQSYNLSKTGHFVVIQRCVVVFFPVFVVFNDEIVSAFSSDDEQVFLLREFQQTQKEKQGVDPVFTNLKDFFERGCAIGLAGVEHVIAGFLHGIVVLNHGMNGPVVFVVQALNHFFKGLHEFEKRNGLDLGSFSGFFANSGKFLLQIPPFDHLHADLFHFSHLQRSFLESFILEDFVHQFLPRIDFIALIVELLSWNQHFGFDAHQRADEQDKFAAEFDVQFFRLVNEVEKIVGDFGDGYIVNIQLIPFNEKQQQVEWSLKLIKLDLVGCLRQRKGIDEKKIPRKSRGTNVLLSAKIPTD